MMRSLRFRRHRRASACVEPGSFASWSCIGHPARRPPRGSVASAKGDRTPWARLRTMAGGTTDCSAAQSKNLDVSGSTGGDFGATTAGPGAGLRTDGLSASAAAWRRGGAPEGQGTGST